MEIVRCLACTKEFRRSPSHIRAKVFCSIECRKAASRIRTCTGCGVKFSSWPVSRTSTHCSWICFKASRWVEVQCVTCHKTFNKRTSEVKKSKVSRGEHACSRACRNGYTSRLLGGSGEWIPGGKHRKYGDRRSWRKVRNIAIARDGHTCQQCGCPGRLHVHHWEPYELTKNNELDNLITLCAECHNDMHDFYRREGFYEDFYREFEGQ